MANTINTLVGMVRNSIRDNGTQQAFPDVVPGNNDSLELTQFVNAALAEYTRYRPLRKPYPSGLSIVAATTTYQLPSDWLKVEPESFRRAAYQDDDDDRCNDWGDRDRREWWVNTVVAGPANAQPHLRYLWYDELQQLVLSEAPLTSYTLQFDYFAQHTAATVPAQWVDIALLPACERALRALATDQTAKLQKWRMANGKLDVDNTTIKDALLKQADEYRERFRQEVVLRPYGTIG